VLIALLLAWAAFAMLPSPVRAHDIYTGVHGRDGTLCCGGSDCARTQYKLTQNGAEFFVRNREWVFIPNERITFLPVPGDSNGDGHFCGRPKTSSDVGEMAKNVFGNWYLYCAFIPPGYV
jgi:hypothetical protein